MNERKRELLNSLAEELNEVEDVERASVFTPEELGTDSEVVRCLVRDMGADSLDNLAECFFLTGREGDDVVYFTTLITVIDEMDEDVAARLYEAVARINFFLPVGGFAIDDAESGLVFKYAVPVMTAFGDDDIKKAMLTAFNDALSVVDKFEGYLMLVATEELSTQKMLDLVLGR